MMDNSLQVGIANVKDEYPSLSSFDLQCYSKRNARSNARQRQKREEEEEEKKRASERERMREKEKMA